MSVFSWLQLKFKQRQNQKFIAFNQEMKNTLLQNAIRNQNDISLAIEQYQNYLWYLGDPDMLIWFYTRGIFQEGSQMVAMDGWRVNFLDYFWYKSGIEKGIKRTHSGLPRAIIDTLSNCLGKPNLSVLNGKEDNIARTKLLNQILKENNFKSTYEKQVKMDMVVGDGAYIITANKDLSDYPIIEYYNGMDCSFEYTGDKITAVIICKRYEYNGTLYECYERRSTQREYNDKTKTYTRKATIEYSLFEHDTKKGYTAVELNKIPQTAKLENKMFDNCPIMFAVPCIRVESEQTKRGVSMFRGKLDQFDDFDQTISQEANIMRAITPVEYVDSNLLDHDKNGDVIMPSSFGKQFVVYKGAESYNETPNQINSVFHDIDFNKLNAESKEVMMRCMSGLISPSSMGYGVSAVSSDASTREKEKITLQTIKNLKEYEIDVIETLCKLVLHAYDFMQNKYAKYENDDISVKFKDYANPTLENKITAFKDAYLSGAMSLDRYISELYGEESKQDQEKEKQALLDAKQQQNEEMTFNLEE